jgi:hypothetical protein
MKTIKLSIAAAATLILGLTSCKKEDTTPTNITTSETGNFEIELEHVWGMNNELSFELGKDLIHPMKKDTLNFSTFKYYLSNMKLKKKDGTFYSFSESYFLIDTSDSTTSTLQLKEIPTGEYTDLYFTFGVDSLHNVSGAQTGALAVSNQMFWGWNTGYIMLKAEGKYVSNGVLKDFVYHLGGFSGVNSIVKEMQISFASDNLVVGSKSSSHAHIQVNPKWLWHVAPSVKSLDLIHMPGQDAKTMASGLTDNQSFILHHLMNE